MSVRESLFRKRQGSSGPSADELREKRLDEIKALVERFMYDLGLLIAGHDPTLEEYVAPQVAQRMKRQVEPFLASGDAMRPNFGDYGELRVEGELVKLDRPVTAHVEFDDHSTRESANGELVASPKRRMQLTLTIDPNLTTISEFIIRPAETGSQSE